MRGIARYEKDLDRLIETGFFIYLGLAQDVAPEEMKKANFEDSHVKKFLHPRQEYEKWYSESVAMVAQLLPDRLEDFRSYYNSNRVRKNISHANYTLTDYLRGVTIRHFGDLIVGPASALEPMQQQLNIIKSIKARFTSSLFDIRTLVHAELMDDELHAAEELNKNGYARAAGAVAGVVIEAHLAAVCDRHGITPRKKNPAIADLLEALKANGIVDTPTWRFIQHLGDIRNKCDHKKTTDPTKTEVADMIEGVRKITKTLF